ncbi:hypothetical protein BCR42DRAFT_403175 [Absidia repens]|uniref:Uncharacterized protein n=1 Tax=Absidia repens TaxID=90262 RepID=A0A1X2IZ34_9FUNG|nr:hypothetical protein BCR42DRAFT_403175 [Absidia repens]
MDLNICLYCEKYITENDKTSFCSNTCRNQESKQETAGGSLQALLRDSHFHTLPQTKTPPSPPNFELVYHRRPSFSYSPISRRRPSSSLSSSSFNSFSSSSTLSLDNLNYFPSSMIDDDLFYPVYTTP